MKKKKAEKEEKQATAQPTPIAEAAPLVGDLFREGSNIAKVYTLLSDGKPHSRKETAAVVGVEDDRWPHVFSALIRRGKVAGKYAVTVADDTATLTFGGEKAAKKGGRK